MKRLSCVGREKCEEEMLFSLEIGKYETGRTGNGVGTAWK